MTEQNPITDALGYPMFPELGASLRARKERIMQRWEEAVRHVLPKSNRLAHEELRDHLPKALDRMAEAIHTSQPVALRAVQGPAKAQARSRFQQAFDVEELIIEYRLLRRIIKEEVAEELGMAASIPKMLALDTVVDVSLQQAVVDYVNYQKAELRAAAAREGRYMAFITPALRNNLNFMVWAIEMLRRKLVGNPESADEVSNLDAASRSITETMDALDHLPRAEFFDTQQDQGPSQAGRGH